MKKPSKNYAIKYETGEISLLQNPRISGVFM